MPFIPIGKDGKQAYPYDDRPFHVRVKMSLVKNLLIPLTGRTVRGKQFYGEKVSGRYLRFVNCEFKHCKFDGCHLVFINRCNIYFDTDYWLENMTQCEVSQCTIFKVAPLEEKGK